MAEFVEVLLEFLQSPAVIALWVALLLALVGMLGSKWLNKIRLVFQLWNYAEKVGLLKGWTGYEKLAFAMKELQERFYDKYGRAPSASEEGWIVKILNLLCKLEDKQDVLDFSESGSNDPES
jgi:hypothetical protein